MIQRSVRVAVATLALGLLVVLGLAAPANASDFTGGCSTTKAVPPTGSISYNYCDGAFASENVWSSYIEFNNNHGAPVVVETQVNLRTDGKDNVLPVHSVTVVVGKSTWDPYNLTGEATLHSCTNGHTYFPIVQVRLVGGSWGPLAGAGQFVC